MSDAGAEAVLVPAGLDHAGILRHVGEEYERQTALEETATATDGEVFGGIPCETDTRRNLDAVGGPFTGVDNVAAHVVFKDGIVGHQL